MLRWILCITLALCCCLPSACAVSAEDEEDWLLQESVILEDDGTETPAEIPQSESLSAERTARDELIDRIIDLGRSLYERANGKVQRAHYASDIYVCKNFTVYLFRKNRDDFRMAAYPDVPLVIPNNLPAAKCKPYYYGFWWEEIGPEKGNPFYVAAQFIYDTSLSTEENEEKAREFMRQAQRGDYFQMSADYEYGVGAHSAIMLRYDPVADSIHWMDSNMRGKKINGIRYGIVQYDREESVDWWIKAFCKKKRGATLYRLRDDMIFVGGTHP